MNLEISGYYEDENLSFFQRKDGDFLVEINSDSSYLSIRLPKEVFLNLIDKLNNIEK